MLWFLLILTALALLGWVHNLLEVRRLRGGVRQLHSQVHLLHKAINGAHGGVFYYNVARGETTWDANTLAIFGLGGKERTIPPGTWESLLHPEDRGAAIAQMVEMLEGKTNIFSHSYRILLPNNEVRWIEAAGYVLRDRSGKPTQMSGFHLDVTKQVLHESSLRESESQAVRAMEAKTLFLANMSHEIRTPMNAIIGMIELLSEAEPSDLQQRYLTTLQNSSDVLMRIINDILDVSKIEAGKLVLEHKSFDLRDVIHECLAVFTQISDQKKLLLTAWIDPSIPRQITGDSTRLQQILMNLISNAFKFTDEGSIVVRVRRDGSRLCFSVADTGIGIAPEKIDRLFERFSQADISTTRQYGGTGLGLTIVKEIVQLWGGHLHVQSTLGNGSCFNFELPCNDPVVDYQPVQKHVLLGTPLNQVYQLWLEDTTAPKVTWAATADDILQQLKTQRFDSIVIDQSLPDADIHQLLSCAQKHLPDSIRILIGFERYLPQQNRALVDHFVARPFLINLLWDPEFLSNAEKSMSNRVALPVDYSHLNVLCVDDNPSNLLVMRGLLKRFGISTETVSSGIKAIEIARTKAFDLILMDYEMPDMDGPEATRRLLQFQQTVVIGLSAHVGSYFEEQALEAGMQDFLRKPVRLVQLASLLERHFPMPSSTAEQKTVAVHDQAAPASD